jgi:hypothetical protein
MTDTTVLKAVFRASGYSEADRRMLRSALEPLGPVRLRPIHPPAAGGAAELMLVAEFIGKAMAEGVIGAATLWYLRELSNAIREYMHYKRTRSEFPGALTRLTLSYDDFEIVVTGYAEEFSGDLDSRIHDIRDHLESDPLVPLKITYIQLPAEFRDGRFAPALSPDITGLPATPNFRYWFVGLLDPRMILDVYDSENRRLVGAQRDQLYPGPPQLY